MQAIVEEQIESGMIEGFDGQYCVCVNKKSKFYGWLFSKHPDGKWVTKRLALPIEIQSAQEKLERLKAIAKAGEAK